MTQYLEVLRKQYAQFAGRAHREEFWMFVLINLLISIGVAVAADSLHLQILRPIYALVMLIPGLAVGARRLHDTDRSGWWLLILLVPLAGILGLVFFWVQQSDPCDNRYGLRGATSMSTTQDLDAGSSSVAVQSSVCNTQVAAAATTRSQPCGAVVKGELRARLRPPFEPFGPYQNLSFALAGITVLLLATSLFLGWIEMAASLGGILLMSGLVLLARATLLLTSVRMHENGLEMDIARSGNKSLYLSWDRLANYRFEGSVFHYSWRDNGLTVLADGRSRSSWPYVYFPRRLKIPDDRTMALLRSLLSRTPRCE